jgi:hypothetical protein
MGKEQVHGKFKVFSGPLGKGGTVGSLGNKVESWARKAKVAPKSIGIEYLEERGTVILSIGYRDDEAPYPVRLKTVALGKIASLEGKGLAKIERAMTAASQKLRNVICHELYVTGRNELLMVFMIHAAR